MKIILLISLFSFFSYSLAKCQSKKRIPKVLIAVQTDSGVSKGYVHAISDTAIEIYLQSTTHQQLLKGGLKTFNYY